MRKENLILNRLCSVDLMYNIVRFAQSICFHCFVLLPFILCSWFPASVQQQIGDLTAGDFALQHSSQHVGMAQQAKCSVTDPLIWQACLHCLFTPWCESARLADLLLVHSFGLSTKCLSYWKVFSKVPEISSGVRGSNF